MNNDYLKLTKAFDRYYILKKINSTLSWDTQVKMPKDVHLQLSANQPNSIVFQMCAM